MELCSFVYCVAEPQPLFGSLAGPVLAIILIASAVGPRPPRLYQSALSVSSLLAFTAILACLWCLFRGPHQALMFISGSACLLMSLTVWLSRGDPDDGGGEEFFEEEPEDPEPGDQADWDEAKRRLIEESSKTPVAR